MFGSKLAVRHGVAALFAAYLSPTLAMGASETSPPGALKDQETDSSTAARRDPVQQIAAEPLEPAAPPLDFANDDPADHAAAPAADSAPGHKADYAADNSADISAEPLSAAAGHSWRRGDPVLEVNAGLVVDEPSTQGMPAAQVLTSTELELRIGLAVFTCPAVAAYCEAELGVVAGLALLRRPFPWFSWGGSIEAQQLGQTWTQGDEVWSRRQRILSSRLLAQVHIATFDDIDPWIGIGIGGGAIYDTARSRDGGASTTQWLGSPLYGARAGLTFRITDGIELGALVDWTNIQVNTGESCPWIVGGVCSSGNWNAFSPESALWNATATVSFAFGEEL